MTRERARRWFRASLLMVPRPLRDRHSADMEADFLDRFDRAAAASASQGRAVVFSAVVDAALASPRQWRARRTLARARREPKGVIAGSLRHDVRLALRSLARAPVFCATAVLTLALGIGANVAIFSILDSLLLKTLPVREADRLVELEFDQDNDSWSNPLWEAIREHKDLAAGSFAWSPTRFNLTNRGESDYVDGLWASGGMFDVLGVRAILGRTFNEKDDLRQGGPDGPVAVIGYGFWERRFGSARDVIGRTLNVEGVTFTIVGVAPRGFFGPDVGRAFDIAVPLGAEAIVKRSESVLDQRSSWWLSIMARLKPGQTVADLRADFRRIQPQVRLATIPPDWPSNQLRRYLDQPFDATPAATGDSSLRGRYGRPLEITMVVVGLVLVVACANIANLLLARASSRRREVAIRRALGASRGQLARQLLIESFVLSGLGVIAALVVAWWGSAFLVRLLWTRPGSVVLDLALDWRALGFTMTLGVGTALLFGTVPALRAAGVQPSEALKEHGRGTIGDARMILNHGLVVVQVALSLLLVVAAGLFVRTFVTLTGRDLGFDGAPIMVVNVDASHTATPAAARSALFDRVRKAVLAVPGVSAAAASLVTPASSSAWMFTVHAPDGLDVRDQGAYVNTVTPGWFTTYNTAVLAGRDFDDRDRKGAPAVAIVNETFARTRFGSASPLGQQLTRRGAPNRPPPPDLEIVGVVRDAVYRSPRDPVPPTMYLSFTQNEAGASAYLSVRAADGLAPTLLIQPLAKTIGEVDRDLVTTFRPLADQISATLVQERLAAVLSGFFGALAVLLAAVGLYGVTSYGVARRRAEIGIRLALGAHPGRVLRLVLRRVAVLVTIGAAIGAALSLWASRFVATLLYGLAPQDPATLAAAVVVLMAVGALAGWLPARRAASLDPARALRDE